MKIRCLLVLSLSSLLASGVSHGAVAAAFGLNFTTTSNGNPTSGTFDGVLFSDWTAKNVQTAANTTVASHAAGTFTLPQSDGAQLTGWVAKQDYWNPGTTGMPANSIFGGTLGGNQTGTSTGLSGFAGLVQFTNVSEWLTANSFTSLSITVYYSAYKTYNGGATDEKTALEAGYANIFSGEVTVGNAATYTSTATLIGSSTGTALGGSGTNPYYLIGSTVTGITDDFLVAERLTPDLGGQDFRGGIAAIKIEGVPEPSTALLGGLGALVLLRRRRR
ncbi:PEP-CTERM sorting domain-containing protein [Luteolibacter arcticus]|uniref:PEP-CTERM sorting domain-containing protein n=1 Tax=Luteolibacter arcticus TaxID=1581411 RepID=A0ABT3GNI8_9BACT|nr:PEP-CTERM sorting domain-containing protein [Luteolibacter arcticus]MCW1925080.1 PEP-CTERM sorting domain-containing protein [Luteolibacter arcticus]